MPATAQQPGVDRATYEGQSLVPQTPPQMGMPVGLQTIAVSHCMSYQLCPAPVRLVFLLWRGVLHTLRLQHTQNTDAIPKLLD
jgi:hypothetical protein